MTPVGVHAVELVPAKRPQSARLPVSPRPKRQPSSSRKATTAMRAAQRRSAPEGLDGLQRADDAERAVEAAAVGHGVEVRPRPDLARGGVRAGAAADERPGALDGDLEARLAHPARHEVVGGLLAAE